MKKLGLAFLFCALAAPALAQGSYPDKPVTLVVPFPPGGAVDIVGRYVADRLSQEWGQPVVVENVAGAGTVIGSAQVAKAAPDGYTLLINSATFTMNAAVQTSLPFDPANDFTAIGMVGSVPLVLAASPALGVADYAAFKARAGETELKYATVGVGSINHFATELLEQAAGLPFAPVHYKGGAPAMADVIGGHTHFFYGSLTQVLPQIRSGQMTGILVSSKDRNPAAPDLPGLGELGMEGAVMEQWWGILGPRGMDPAVVDKINADITAIARTPEMAEFLAKEGGSPRTAGAQEFGDLIGAELARWREVARTNGIKAE